MAFDSDDYLIEVSYNKYHRLQKEYRFCYLVGGVCGALAMFGFLFAMGAYLGL